MPLVGGFSSYFFFFLFETSHCRALQICCVGLVQAYLCALSELKASGVGIPCYL